MRKPLIIYLDEGENTFEGINRFSVLAGELGFEHHVVEGIWQRWSDAQLRELVASARQRNVGIWLAGAGPVHQTRHD